MKIIISPAKKMRDADEWMEAITQPILLEKTEILKEWLCSLSKKQAQDLWKCNDRLAELNYERLQHMNLQKGNIPALLAYEGIQYQYMSPQTFETEHWDYVQTHLRILSGFYGILRPMDGVVPYRLEMKAEISCCEKESLYDFWGSSLYDALMQENKGRLIINLASKEYASCIQAYLKPEDRMISCIFAEEVEGKLKQKATLAKMARGEMVRFMAEHNITDPEALKRFDALGFQFDPEASEKNVYVYRKKEK